MQPEVLEALKQLKNVVDEYLTQMMYCKVDLHVLF